MKKLTLKIMTAILAVITALSFTACTSGASAYDIAVKNGFKGTEAEWLASLNGANGKDGKDSDITIETLYAAAKADGYTGTLSEFIKEYLSENTDSFDEKASINKAMFSVCDVITTFTTKDSETPFGTIKGETVTSAGAGVVYSLDKEQGDALVITNYHVVYNADGNTSDGISDNIKLYFYGYELRSDSTDYGVAASYVGGSMTYDIAVLKVENSELLKTSDVCAADISDKDRTVVGSKVFAVGNPSGSGIAASSGIVSVDSEYITMTAADDKTKISYRCIRVDCAINPGNSGGGLFDISGNLVGIVNAKVVSSNVDNIGYAIPVSLVVKVADNIVRNAEKGKNVYAGRMGITVKTNSSKAYYDKDNECAVLIEEVTIEEASGELVKDSLKAGDTILAISKNGGAEKTVERRYDVTDFMLTVSVGDTVTLKVKRTESGAEKEYSYNFTLTQSNFVTVK